MDPRVERLKTPEECAAFIVNARARGHEDLAREARRRAVTLRTDAYGPKSDLERRCVEAIYAHEETLSARDGRRVSATKTWQDLRKLGPVSAIDRAVSREDNDQLQALLVELGLEAYAFEALVLEHPQEFSFQAVERSRARVARRQQQHQVQA